MILRVNDRIRNRKVDFFNKFNLSLRYDSVASAFGFSGYFNPDNNEHKDLFCIGHYHLVTLEHNDELLLTGYMLSEKLKDSSKTQPIIISGYSLPGCLEDCKIPTSLYPLESNNLSLSEIAKKLIAPFGLKMVIDPAVLSAMNKVYEKATAKEGQTIKAFLTELAGQRDIIISHNEHGNILFTKAKTKRKPIIHYGADGGVPFTSMELDFNGQAMHSDITVIKEAGRNGGNAGEASVKNPYVRHVFRPDVISQTSGDDNDTMLVAKRRLAAELKNLKLTIVTDRWEIDGKIIRPNNLITVTNPKVYLFKKSTWFIEQIDFAGDEKSTTATLTCCIPESYSGETPKYLWEGINMH